MASLESRIGKVFSRLALGPFVWRSLDAAEAAGKHGQSAWQRGVVEVAKWIDNNRGAFGPFLAVGGGVIGTTVGFGGPLLVRAVLGALIGLGLAWGLPTLAAGAVALCVPRVQRQEARGDLELAETRLADYQRAIRRREIAHTLRLEVEQEAAGMANMLASATLNPNYVNQCRERARKAADELRQWGGEEHAHMIESATSALDNQQGPPEDRVAEASQTMRTATKSLLDMTADAPVVGAFEATRAVELQDQVNDLTSSFADYRQRAERREIAVQFRFYALERIGQLRTEGPLAPEHTERRYDLRNSWETQARHYAKRMVQHGGGTEFERIVEESIASFERPTIDAYGDDDLERLRAALENVSVKFLQMTDSQT